MPALTVETPLTELEILAQSVGKGKAADNPWMTADKVESFKIATGVATEDEINKPRMLHPRFAALKQEIIREEDIPAVTASWKRLKIALAAEVERIENEQQAAIPEVEWSTCLANGKTQTASNSMSSSLPLNFLGIRSRLMIIDIGGNIPEDVAARARHAGAIVFRGVIPEKEALGWKEHLIDYTKRHPGVGGRPRAKPTSWMLFWTKPQVEARSHPEVMKAQRATGKLWNLTDQTVPVDFETGMTYVDRFRIRHPGK